MNSKIKVNISCPFIWEFDNVLKLHSPNQAMIWGDYEFLLNQDYGKFDYWVILGQIERNTNLYVPEGGVILVTMEEQDVVPKINQKFLEQFDLIITTRNDISQTNVIKSHYFTKWHISKSYDELKENCKKTSISKTKNLSAVISSKIQFGVQQKRYAFMNKIQGHFKNKLDWFNRDENPLNDKWNGLSDYRFSIAIENSSHPGYFTEKLIDPILADSIPIYWGAPNIFEYFPPQLIKLIDINDYLSSIDKIEKLIESESDKEIQILLRDSKLKILDEYQIFPWIVKILSTINTKSKKHSNRRILKEDDINLFSRLKSNISNIVKIKSI